MISSFPFLFAFTQIGSVLFFVIMPNIPCVLNPLVPFLLFSFQLPITIATISILFVIRTLPTSSFSLRPSFSFLATSVPPLVSAIQPFPILFYTVLPIFDAKCQLPFQQPTAFVLLPLLACVQLVSASGITHATYVLHVLILF